MSAVDYCICIEELARVDPAIALSVAAHNGLCTAHIVMFGNDAQKQQYLPRLVKGEVLGAWGLTEAERRQRRRRRCGRRRCAQGDVLGPQRLEDVHHPRRDRRRDGGHGGHRSREGRIAASRRSSSSTARRACRAGKKENKLGMRASDTSEVIFAGLPRAGRAAARRRRAGLHQHAAGARRRPHRHRGALGRPRAGRVRSGAPLRAGAPAVRPADRRRSRRFSGSWRTRRRGSKRRGC